MAKFFHSTKTWISFCIILFIMTGPAPAAEDILTVAESSDFKATSTYADVMDFIHKLQLKSSLFRVETLCTSPEGRDVPLLVIGRPLPSSPPDLRFDGRAVIYIQANIHAGEVEGKEASLMLVRDILGEENPPFLDDLVLLISPIFNADGNERISPSNRRNQKGPEKGVGIRYNGQNLDLNRDGIKMESPEVQGFVHNVLNRWDPVLFVDCHTTNGSPHKEPVTYSWPLNPNGDISIISYMRDKMMPAVNTILKEKYDTLSIPYGNFMDFRDPEKGWGSAGPEPRFLTNYVGLRNRLSILNENYAYADYKTRVWGCYYFLKSILEYCADHKTEIQTLVREADKRTAAQGLDPREKDVFGTEFERKPLKDPVTVLGWEMKITPREKSYPRVEITDVEKTYSLPYYADFAVKESVQRPFGYLIPLNDAAVTEKLLQHGLVVERLILPEALEVEAFRVKNVKAAPRIYQGHRMNTLEGEYLTRKVDFPAGTLFVPAGQALGNLASYLLEPESDDGLAVWNFFDRYIVAQWRRNPQIFPVYRLLKPVNLVKEVLSPK
jgi:hypothetical protein